MVSFEWKFCSHLLQELLFLFSWFWTCFYVVLFDGHQFLYWKRQWKIISYPTSIFHIWFYSPQPHPHFANVFSGQRCLTHSVVPLHCPFWFPWKKQNCTHISRYGKTIGLCEGIMTFSSGNSSMQCAFLMAAVCQGAIFVDLPLVSKGYHSWVALVSSESICPFQLASSFESLGNHPVMSLSNLLCILSKGTSVYPKRGVRYYSRPLAPNSSTGKVCPGVQI